VEATQVYEKIKIQNFRSLRELEITDLKPVNLFVGKNGCGKTTLLECMFLLTGPANPNLPIAINIFRNYFSNIDDYMWRLLFNDLDVSQDIIISGEISEPKQVRSLTIKPNYQGTPLLGAGGAKDLQSDTVKGNTISSTFITGLNLELELTNVPKPPEKYLSQVFMDPQGTKLLPAPGYKETLYGSFINTKTMLENNIELAKDVSEATVHNSLGEIVSVLQLIEPSISDVRLGYNNVVLGKIGDHWFPLSFLGDGINRIFQYLIKIYEGKNGVLFIDEIENGLYYSSLEILWKTVFESAKKFNVQIFATTHSIDCVRVFSSVYSESGNESDGIRLYRIERKGNQHKAISFNDEELKSALESGWEMR
jgi:hypothetical protein